MKKYISASMEVVRLQNDIIATSGYSTTGGTRNPNQTLTTGDTGGHRLIWD